MKREELIKFTYTLRSWGVDIPRNIMTAAIDEYQSLSPSPQPSTAEEILRKYVFTEGWNHTDVVSKENALKAMEEYAAHPVAERLSKCCDYPIINNRCSRCLSDHSKPVAEREVPRFQKPSDKEIVEIAIFFNDGKLNKEKLIDMVAMCEFVIARLYENGNVSQPSSKE